MDFYMDECICRIYGISQPCFILLASCTKVPYDNYNILGINETFINNLFTITLELLHWIFCIYPTINYNNDNNKIIILLLVGCIYTIKAIINVTPT